MFRREHEDVAPGRFCFPNLSKLHCFADQESPGSWVPHPTSCGLEQSRSACCLRAICVTSRVFHGLTCHPWLGKLLEIRFLADSNPTLSAIPLSSITG